MAVGEDVLCAGPAGAQDGPSVDKLNKKIDNLTFKTGDGKPDPRLPGLGKCNKCVAAQSALAA